MISVKAKPEAGN